MDNSNTTPKVHRKRGASLDDIYRHNKHIKEERLDLQTTDDLTSLSPLNEDTGLIPFVLQVGNIQPVCILYQ